MDQNKEDRYLITGGAGFVGSHFVEYLYDQKSDACVTVLDKLTYAGNLENLKACEKKSGYRFIKGDICDSKVVEKVMQDVDVVVNFAAESSVDRSIDDSISFLKTNAFGVYTLLEAARRQKKLKKFIQISTDEVYGEILSGSFTEKCLLKPCNPYAAAKAAGDQLSYSFFKTYQLPVIITRGSNSYGPRCYPEKIMPLFITNLIEGSPIPLYGEGRQVRDWLYVEDHCAAIYALLKEGTQGEVYNIGGEQECSNMMLAENILSEMGADKSSIRFVDDRPGHDFRYSLNCEKLKNLGWQRKYELQEGLKKTVDWYKNNEAWWRPLKEKMDKRFADGYWGG